MKPLIIVVAVLALVACDQQSSADNQQRQQQEQLARQGNMTVGMPSITRFAEKKALKDIYELRDRMTPTITYVMDMNGNLHKRCDSLGYGIPYATEYTNPQKIEESGNNGITSIDQADPNGLFSPASAEGTWVLCVNPQTKQADPVYIEDRIEVSPFALN